jgi:hypothetical protein
VRVIKFGSHWITPGLYFKVFPGAVDKPRKTKHGEHDWRTETAEYSPDLMEGIVPIVRAKCPNVHTLLFEGDTDRAGGYDRQTKWTASLGKGFTGHIELVLWRRSYRNVSLPSDDVDTSPPNGFTIGVSTQVRLRSTADNTSGALSSTVFKTCTALILAPGIFDAPSQEFKSLFGLLHPETTPSLDSLEFEGPHSDSIQRKIDFLAQCGGRIRGLAITASRHFSCCPGHDHHGFADIQRLMHGIGKYAPQLKALHVVMSGSEDDYQPKATAGSKDRLPQLAELRVDVYTARTDAWPAEGVVDLAGWASHYLAIAGRLVVQLHVRYICSAPLDMSDFAASYRR